MRVERVESLEDPRVADYRDVKDADLRGRDGLFMCEGRLGVRRLIDGGRFRPRSVFVTPTALEAMRDALEPLPAAAPVYVAEASVLSGVVGYDMHRGCLAAAERGDEPDTAALFAGASAPRLALALEQLTNPDNVGGLFRNAMAFGVGAVLLDPRCSDPLYRKAVRVSMGGALQVPFTRSRDWPGDLKRLADLGYLLLALAPRGELEVSDLAERWRSGAEPPPERVALLVGSEGEGLTPEVLALADRRLRIDMAAGVDSLNVATAAAVALHQLARGRPGPA